MKNRLGQYVVVNNTLVLRCGLTSKERLIGRTACEVFPTEMGTRYAEQDRLVLTTGVEIRQRLELHLYTNRRWGWCLTSKFPLRDDHGRIVGVAGLSEDLRQPKKGRKGHHELARVIEHMQEHYTEPLRIADVARKSGLSIPRLGRLVRRVFQLTPQQLLIRTRLEAASQMLVRKSMTITEVAHACGYSDHSAFTRQFKAIVGVTPTAFRRLARTRRGFWLISESKGS